METRELQVIDAFTDTPFRGNPAGVVLAAGGLTDEQMQDIAREVHASETAFVCGGRFPDPFRVRFFTPAEEVPLCGHATVATFHALAWAGTIPLVEGEMVVQLEANVGLLPIRLKVEGEKLTGLLMGQKPPVQEPYREDLAPLAAALGVSGDAVEEGDEKVGPPAVVSTGCRCLHVALPELSSVTTARPDFRALAELSRNLDVVTIQMLTLETELKEAYVHVRTFAPSVGIDEDPVTGTAAGSLGGYLAYINYLPEGSDKRRFLVEQGVEVGRPGRIQVELQLVGQSVTEVWVGGRAAAAFKGEIQIPGT